MTGGEYLTSSVLQILWDAIDAAFRAELAESKAQYLKLIASAPSWGAPHYGLANVYERQKDLPKACREWRKFLELSPAARGSTTAAKKLSTCK